ncbi:hypothetical protein Z946_3525 [Sulfitobacter noctilucicola]|nr:hypothetical protein Z946_3525 [Sulfitobacter noctilucicola]
MNTGIPKPGLIPEMVLAKPSNRKKWQLIMAAQKKNITLFSFPS